MDLTESASYGRVQNVPLSVHASSLRVLRRGASGAFIVSVCGTGLGFVANLVIARVIGRDEYGIYALMFSWISVLAVMVQAGQDISMIRFVPTYIRNGAWGKVHGLRRGVGALVLVISVCVAIVGCVVVNALGEKHGQTWRDAFYIGFVLLPIWAQLQLSGALHRAFKRPVVMGMYQTIARPLLLIAQMGIFALMLPRVTASWAAAATAVTALLVRRREAAPLAYIGGSMGTLIGADLLNLDKAQGLGAPVISIGGAGTFDGIFVTGVLAVLIAGFAGRPTRGP